jgi:very-short-patch-repair endonuclease
VNGIEVDLLWREQRLVVEVDGFAYPSGRAAFERDRVRDSRLVALGNAGHVASDRPRALAVIAGLA